MDLDPHRQQSIQAAMRAAGLDVLLCAAPSQVLLLTGYWPIMGASIALVTASGQVHVLAPTDEISLAQATSGASLTAYAPSTLDRLLDPVAALADPLTALLGSLGLARARFGLELGYGVQPASYLTEVHFRSSLAEIVHQFSPSATVTGCDTMLERLKATKTPRELSHLRAACRAASPGFAAAPQWIHPGARENEIAAGLESAFLSALPSPEPGQTDAFERAYGSFFCMSGPNSVTASAAFARTRIRTLDSGDLVMIHANTCGDGFWTDITRTYTALPSPGSPAPELHGRMRAAISEATAAALDRIRPGARAADVDQAARNVMQAHHFGPNFVHGLGHGVGFAAANGDALPRLHPASPDVLEPGMTFNIEPAAYLHGVGGMRHCNVVAVTGSGAELLTDF